MSAPATRKNLFGFGRKPAPVQSPRRGRGGLSLSEASAAAVKAGRKSADLSEFDSWLERKHLDTRSDAVVDRIRDAYKRGVQAADAAEQNREFLKEKREQAREAARDRREQARDRAKSKKAAGPAYSSMPDEKTLEAGFKRGLTLADMLRANPSLRKAHKANPGLFARLMKKFKRNPAAASAQVFQDFHGFEPSEVVTVTKKVHHHAHLASLGILVYLEVWGVDKVGHTLNGFKKALLACNEDRNQLFIEGGDQRIDLEHFGIRQAHELETLGKCLTVAYSTDKKHLGKEGGQAVYVHDFTTTNENGKHVKVPEARLPQLIYDVRNEQLLFSGGSYEILREGIDK